MKLKIGDKVKIVSSPASAKHLVGCNGTIIEVRDSKYNFPYRVRFDSGFFYPVLASEIEKVSEKGKQLLLFEL